MVTVQCFRLGGSVAHPLIGRYVSLCLEEIKGFLALISLVSLAIRSSCLSNSILSAQVHESLKHNHASKFVVCFNSKSCLCVEN